MMNRIILLLLLASAFIAGCASSNTCPKVPSEGNISSPFNTDNDEYSPSFWDNSFYYTVSNRQKKINETIYRSEFTDGKFSRPKVANDLPIGSFQNVSSLSFCKNPNSGNLEIWFAANTRSNNKINRDLFFAEQIGESWNNPQNAKSINTEHFESHPFVSPDGKILIFSSDRPNGKGGLDLYVSIRDNKGNWSSPRNLTEVNTDANEISPYLSEDGVLYFSSQGYSNPKVYNIVKATPSGYAKWANPKLMPPPINSSADDTGPAIFKDKIFVSSNRPNGCGGKDLYAFDLCGPAKIECYVTSSFPNFPLSGKAYLFDNNNSIVATQEVSDFGIFKFDIIPNRRYTIRYENSCNSKYTAEREIQVPCSDSSVVVVRTMFEFNPVEEFDLVEIKVPFFVTGYYQPNTRENLEALRLKFAYNLIGIDEQTKYIERPGEIYDSFTEEVEKALTEAAEKLYDIVSLLNDNCLEKDDIKIQVVMHGFADPRSISPKAVFPDADVEDEKFGVFVKRGDKMDNDLLSLLRAYYTAKYFERYISLKSPNLNNKIIWKIEGKGVDNSTLPDKQKRRVNIKILPM